MENYQDQIYLAHHGVKGMKWGHRKKSVRKNYISKNRSDITIYGQRGANRIKKRMATKGMTHKKAERREIMRGMAGTAAMSFTIIALLNPSLAKFGAMKTAQLAGSAAGSIGRKVVSATGGYSYKNAAKYVAMNVMNKARGVTYL